MVGWDARDDCISGADAKKATYVAFGDDEVASKIDDMVAAKKKSLADEGRSESDRRSALFQINVCTGERREACSWQLCETRTVKHLGIPSAECFCP